MMKRLYTLTETGPIPGTTDSAHLWEVQGHGGWLREQQYWLALTTRVAGRIAYLKSAWYSLFFFLFYLCICWTQSLIHPSEACSLHSPDAQIFAEKLFLATCRCCWVVQNERGQGGADSWPLRSPHLILTYAEDGPHRDGSQLATQETRLAPSWETSQVEMGRSNRSGRQLQRTFPEGRLQWGNQKGGENQCGTLTQHLWFSPRSTHRPRASGLEELWNSASLRVTIFLLRSKHQLLCCLIPFLYISLALFVCADFPPNSIYSDSISQSGGMGWEEL